MTSDRITARELRLVLRQAELAVARVQRNSAAEDILALYALFDQIAGALPRLQQAGVRLEPELARFETICSILHEKARFVVRALNTDAGLEAYRRSSSRPEDHWWWYLDHQVAQQKRQRRARLLRISVIGAVSVALLVALYVLFLRPDEATRLRYDYQFEADAQVQQGNYEQALGLYQKALELAPEDAELVLVTGVLYEALQELESAADQYREAERRYESPVAFRAARAQQYILLGWFERAAEEAQTAIDLDDRYALAHCTLGSAYEQLDDKNAAMAALWRCSELASEQGQDELYVHAKMRLATLMQQAP
jgi:tetratricopeptide (TPR) repeat protein